VRVSGQQGYVFCKGCARVCGEGMVKVVREEGRWVGRVGSGPAQSAMPSGVLVLQVAVRRGRKNGGAPREAEAGRE